MDKELSDKLRDARVRYMKDLPSPEELREKIVSSNSTGETTLKARKDIKAILAGKDDRLLGLVGPCSIHDYDSAVEYAHRLKNLRDEVSDEMLLVMRAYPEKPRTKIGWRGFIREPFIDGHANYAKGLELTRKLCCEITDIGVPITMEILGDRNIQYFDETVSHGSVGARTIESMPQRDVVTVLSMPIGLKNNTEGNIDVALDAVETVVHGTELIGMSSEGYLVEMGSYGNADVHVILRGGNGSPNYTSDKISYTADTLRSNQLPAKVLVDCSHGNSGKDYRKQPGILDTVVEEFLKSRKEGKKDLMGFMLESHLEEGRQDLPSRRNAYTFKTLNPRKSITDGCIGWKQTEEKILETYEKLKASREY